MIINFSNIGGGSGSGSGLSPDNYYTKAQIDSQGYVTSADSVNYATSADIKTVTDHIEESEQVISTAINDLNSRIASGGSGGANQVEYVDNLNFSGDTSKLYMYNNKLYRWTTNSGSLATIVGQLSYDNDRTNYGYGVYHYDYLNQSFDGQLMFAYQWSINTQSYTSETMYVYFDYTNDRLLAFHGEESTPLVSTPLSAFTKGTQYELHPYNRNYVTGYMLWEDGKISFRTNEDLRATSLPSCLSVKLCNRLNVNGPHFELVDKEYILYSANWDFSGSTKSIMNGLPSWNSKGLITGIGGRLFDRTCYVNGTSGSGKEGHQAHYYSSYNNTTTNFPDTFYAPESSGNEGDIPISHGANKVPTWVTLASLMGGVKVVKCTEAEYENMSSHDASTLYIIDPGE